MTASGAFSYWRRVQFAETDASGIVHFSWMFRYMEEAEHALWRAAGLTIAGRDVPHGWPRVSAAFDFRSPLYFEDEFVVNVRLEEVGRRSLRYAHEIVRAQTIVGTGAMVTVCVRTSENGTMHAVERPADVIPKLRTVLDRESS
jgi:YbgC/YbaW family acyl-CoA thioester hydrolase